MVRDVVRRAARDTLALVGYRNAPQAIVALLSVVAAFVLFRRSAPDDQVFSQVDWLLASFKALVSIGILAFIVNLIRAPYLMLLAERDSRAQREEGLRRAAALAAAECEAVIKRLTQERDSLLAKLDQRQQRRDIRDTLGAFLEEGKMLRRECRLESQPPPIPKADEWRARVRRFLRTHPFLGPAYEARFESNTGSNYIDIEIQSPQHRKLSTSIEWRMKRLEQFIVEFSPAQET